MAGGAWCPPGTHLDTCWGIKPVFRVEEPTMTAAALPPSDATHRGRRFWLMTAGTAGGVAAVAATVPFIATLTPSERAKALGAAITVDIGDLAPGAMKTVEWRGKPVWIQRRTPEMLASLTLQDAALADPASLRDDLPEELRNPGRSLQPEIFVAIGICTHLGCSPSAVAEGSGHPGVGADWHGGFFCPCHGSTFDIAGRVFKNKPAPTNLEIPPHRYLSQTRLVIGDTDMA
jgi:ubiquinol-cytochrome c reductase iron-sulfur subunit